MYRLMILYVFLASISLSARAEERLAAIARSFHHEVSTNNWRSQLESAVKESHQSTRLQMLIPVLNKTSENGSLLRPWAHTLNLSMMADMAGVLVADASEVRTLIPDSDEQAAAKRTFLSRITTVVLSLASESIRRISNGTDADPKSIDDILQSTAELLRPSETSASLPMNNHTGTAAANYALAILENRFFSSATVSGLVSIWTNPTLMSSQRAQMSRILFAILKNPPANFTKTFVIEVVQNLKVSRRGSPDENSILTALESMTHGIQGRGLKDLRNVFYSEDPIIIEVSKERPLFAYIIDSLRSKACERLLSE